jgi:hypothetical protein
MKSIQTMQKQMQVFVYRPSIIAHDDSTQVMSLFLAISQAEWNHGPCKATYNLQLHFRDSRKTYIVVQQLTSRTPTP